MILFDFQKPAPPKAEPKPKAKVNTHKKINKPVGLFYFLVKVLRLIVY